MSWRYCVSDKYMLLGICCWHSMGILIQRCGFVLGICWVYDVCMCYRPICLHLFIME